jgi:lipopolysaccharide export system permease protein
MRLLGLRTKRKLNKKEIILNEPDYPALKTELQTLMEDCMQYGSRKKLLNIPSYYAIFFKFHEDHTIRDIKDRVEALVEQLHNSRDTVIIGLLNEMPILYTDAHARPFNNKRQNVIAGVILPFGILLWLRIWRFRLRLHQDISLIQKLGQQIIERIDKNIA